jgi:hypothetical protein
MDWSNPWILLVCVASTLAYTASVSRTLLGRRGHTRRPGSVAPYLLLFGAGSLGTAGGVVTSFKAVATAIPDEQATLLAVGLFLALEPIQLALLLISFLALVDGLGALVGSPQPVAPKPISRVGLAFLVGAGLACLKGSLDLLRAGQGFIMSSASEEVGRAAVSSTTEALGSAGANYTVASFLALVLVVVGLIRGIRV